MENFRKANENDIRGINKVIEANQKEPNAVYRYPCRFDDNENLNHRDRIVFVSEVENTIIAFLTLDGKNILTEANDATVIMVVHPSNRSRKKHYGEKLLKYVISYVINETLISCINSGIKKENSPSINLCEKCGFLRIEGIDEKSKGFNYRLNINR